MISPEWARDDDALLALISAAVTTELSAEQGAGVSAAMLRAANDAYTWLAVDQDLERLTVASGSPINASGTWSRVVEMHGRTLCLDLEVGDQVIDGRVYPAHVGLVTFIPAAGPTVETITDGTGFFTIDRPTAGPFRLRCDTADTAVMTDWTN